MTQKGVLKKSTGPIHRTKTGGEERAGKAVESENFGEFSHGAFIGEVCLLARRTTGLGDWRNDEEMRLATI